MSTISDSSGLMKTGSSEQTVLESFFMKNRSIASCLDSPFDFVVRARSESFEAMVSFFFILWSLPLSISVEEALGPLRKILSGRERSTTWNSLRSLLLVLRQSLADPTYVAPDHRDFIPLSLRKPPSRFVGTPWRLDAS